MYSLEELFDMEMRQLSREHGKDPDPAAWRWSPLDIREFDVMLGVARQCALRELPADQKLRRLRIWEAGSGIGTKLYWAKNEYEMIEVGWEINDEYLEQSAKLDVYAEKHDLSTEMPNLPAYDIVYVARPFKGDDFEAQWERDIHDGMRPGTVLIAAFAAIKPYAWPNYFRKPWRGVWVKPVEGKAYTPSVEKLLQPV